MALTRITKGVIKPNENYDTHNINSTGIITAVGGNFSGNVSVGGVLTYEDVTSIDSVGIITAQKDIHVGAGVSVVGVVTATTFVGALTGTASGNTTIIGAGNNKIVTSYQNNELVAENGLTWTGSVFETSGGAETWTMRAKSGGPSSKIGFQNQYLSNGFTIGCGAANQSFVVYTGGNNERVRIDSTGITTFSQNLFASKDFDVDGHTNLDNVSIAGVTTVTTFLQVLGQAGTSDKGFEVRANSTQNTDTNKAIRIRNNSNTDTFNISYKGKVTATELDISGNIDVDGHTNLDNVSVAGVSTFSGVVRVPNGSAGAPAIHFGDSDSGVYGDSSNGVRLTAGGSDTIVATTNGVTFPPQATALTSLTLGSQSALSKPLYFADAASVQSSSILLDNSSQELRIKNGRFSGQITFTTYNTEKLRIASNGTITATGTGELKLISATADNTNKNCILLTGHYDTAEEDYSGVIIRSDNGDNTTFIGGGLSGYNSATKIRFYTSPNQTTTLGTERFRINPLGQLISGGYADPYPTRSLTVQSVTGQTNTYISIVAGNTSSVSGITFGDASGQAAGNYAGMFEYRHNDDSLRYLQNADEKLRITSDGKVLIGSGTVTASFGGKLQLTNSNFAMNSFANNQHAQTLLFAKSRGTSGSGGSIVGSGDFCGHIEWYADDGVDTGNQIAKISGQMDGSPGANDTPGRLIFYTTVDGANAASERMTISSGGVVHIGSTAVSNTIPTGGLDLQGNNTNCVVEMGNPLPNYSAGRVPTFRIKTRDPDKAVDFSSMWGGDNGIWKHMTLAGGATIFYNGTNDTEIVRITGSALMVGTTSDSVSTQAAGISLNNDAAIVSRRNGVMQYYKSIATGGYYANVFMSANTTVGSIFFNSGGTQFNTSSDYRRKENVVSLTDGISKLKQLKPYRFNFKDNPSVTVDGFLAHEAQEIVPHTVTGTKDQVSTSNDVAVGIASTVGEPIYQQMDLSKLVPLLTAALQDEISKREALEARVAALESS